MHNALRRIELDPLNFAEEERSRRRQAWTEGWEGDRQSAALDISLLCTSGYAAASSSAALVLRSRFTHFPSFQEHKIQEPRLVHFAEVDFLRMVADEVEDVLFTDETDIVAIPLVPACAPQAILQPAVLDPPGNLVVVLPEAQFKLPHRVAVSNASGGAESLQLVDDGAFRTAQPVRDCC